MEVGKINQFMDNVGAKWNLQSSLAKITVISVLKL